MTPRQNQNSQIAIAIGLIAIVFGIIGFGLPNITACSPNGTNCPITSQDFRIGLVLDSKFDSYSISQNAGTTVYDWSAYQNHGTVDNAATRFTRTFCKIDDCVKNVATDGAEIIFPDKPQLDPTTQFSISFWLNMSANTNNQAFVGKGGNGQYEIREDGTTQKLFFRISVNGGTTDSLDSTTILSLNTWYFIIATWDATNMIIYLNGIQDAIKGRTGTGDTTTTPFYVGCRASGIICSNSMIDEVRFYNIALSSTEVLQVYNYETALIGSYSAINYNVPFAVWSAQGTGLTTTQSNLVPMTSYTSNGIFVVGCDLDVTAFTSGTLTCQVTYTDWNSAAQTITIDTATALGDTNGNSVTILAKASTIITLKTAGIITLTYNIGISIEAKQ